MYTSIIIKIQFLFTREIKMWHNFKKTLYMSYYCIRVSIEDSDFNTNRVGPLGTVRQNKLDRL